MRSILIGLLLFFTTHTVAEEITFDMSVWGFTFGQMVVSKTMENDSTELYTLNAKGKVSFLWFKKEGSTKYEVRFRNDKLFSSSYIRIVNGEMEYWNKVQFNGEKYDVESNNGNRHFTEVPEYSVLALYFNPITEHKRVYCEAESEFSTVTDAHVDRFKLNCTDGSHTVYHLENGQVKRLEIHASLTTVKIKRVD
ncbi:MAG: hypothetical protein QF371_03335 [Flavobacteriales bacterium]|nr:hypothetical protein [Flavobacteriales bacterium]